MSLYRIRLRNDTAAVWEADNPILAEGEPGVELDTYRIKIGDGTNAWMDLPYAGEATADARALTDGVLDIDRIPVGTGPNTVAAGNDPRFDEAHTPTGAAGGVLAGTYPSPTLAVGYGVIAPTFSYAGQIAAGNMNFRWYNDYGRILHIQNVRVAVGTSPTGTDAIFDLLNTEVSVFADTSGRPRILAGSNTGVSGVPSNPVVDPGDYLTIAIAQVGSTFPGANLTITVVMS